MTLPGSSRYLRPFDATWSRVDDVQLLRRAHSAISVTRKANPAEFTKSQTPRWLCSTPPRINPMIFATAPVLPARPWTTPWRSPAFSDKSAMIKAHISPLPTAIRIAPPNIIGPELPVKNKKLTPSNKGTLGIRRASRVENWTGRGASAHNPCARARAAEVPGAASDDSRLLGFEASGSGATGLDFGSPTKISIVAPSDTTAAPNPRAHRCQACKMQLVS